MLAVLIWAWHGLSQGQDSSVDDELFRSAEQWARDNLSDDALSVLDNIDREKAKQFFADMQKEFQGKYVLDLGALREPARGLLPLLENYEETLPYAVWLKPRLEYLDVAESLRPAARSPAPEPGRPAQPAPNPAPQKEREVWLTKVVERRWPENSKAYVPRLKPIFTSNKIPSELVWLAELESSFDPRARSPAGAAGMFQLMPATAKQYGLRTWPFDQRLNPETSAEAAARHLSYLHSRFKDWRLALAAYNAGEGTVKELLTRKKARTFDQIAVLLPAETQMYVPRFEAILLRREGLRLNELKNPQLSKLPTTGSG